MQLSLSILKIWAMVAQYGVFFLKSREINAEILVTIDADGQHKIEDVKKVTKPIVDGQADISIGSRFLEEGDNAPKYRKLGINIITKVTNSSLS